MKSSPFLKKKRSIRSSAMNARPTKLPGSPKQNCQEKLLSENGQRKTWQKPPVGFLKLNSDGSFFSDEKTGGWGFIIRDKNGEVIKAAAGKEDCILDAFHAELLGVQAGLRMAINLGTTRLYIETDASLVKEAVEGGEYRQAAMGGIVTEIKHLHSSEFLFSSIDVCPCVCITY